MIGFALAVICGSPHMTRDARKVTAKHIRRQGRISCWPSRNPPRTKHEGNKPRLAGAAIVGSVRIQSRGLQQFTRGRNMIGDSRGHCGRDPQGPMHAARVVKRKPDHQCRAMVLETLRIGIREPSEPAKAHPYRYILSLDVRRTGAFRVGSADALNYLRARHFSGAVARLAFRRSAETFTSIA